MYCPNCGNQISDDSNFCSNCGEAIGGYTDTQYDESAYRYDESYRENQYNHTYDESQAGYHNSHSQTGYYNEAQRFNEKGYIGGQANYYYEPRPRKSRVVAGLLQIFLGFIGAGRFYTGYTGIGIAQLLTTFLCGIGIIWSFIDGILFLCGQVQTDAKGIPFKD